MHNLCVQHLRMSACIKIEHIGEKNKHFFVFSILLYLKKKNIYIYRYIIFKLKVHY